MAALEAMACHVPVISSDIGGLPEVNIHGETGFLSSVGDVESMAKHAIHLLSNQQRHEQFKEQAYQRALQFELELILPQYEAHYDRVLKTSRQMPESIL